jgi:hypothetical protein
MGAHANSSVLRRRTRLRRLEVHEEVPPSVGDLAAEQASRTFAGRRLELSSLLESLSNSGPPYLMSTGLPASGNRGCFPHLQRAHAVTTLS